MPELSFYLLKPEFVEIILRSIGKLILTSPREVLSLATKGIASITEHSPDDVQAFTAPEVDSWLTEVSRASAGLKLPTSQLRYPLRLIPISDLCYAREWQLSISSADAALTIPEPMFSHAVTVLELLGRDVQDVHNNLDIGAQSAPDWRLLRLTFKRNEWSRLQLEQVADKLLPNAFFAGVSDTIREAGSTLTLEIKGVCFQKEEPHVAAYSEILGRLYDTQSYTASLHRIIHDLKNQVIAVRNYAKRAIIEPTNKYSMYAAIEQLQQKVRSREAALALFFKTADEPGVTGINLQRTIRDFNAKQLSSIHESIRLEFTDSLDTVEVLASKELLTSLLENLTLNAIEAMPEGGVLSVSASYRASDSVLELNVSDTGVGIPSDALPGLFTSLKSTKAKGMGLGLAVVKRIVEQHGGLIDVASHPGVGTKFTVLLPLQKVGDVSNASTRN